MGNYFLFQKLKFNNQNMKLMEIEEIKNKIRHEEYEISSHAEKERYDEGHSQNRPIHIVCGYSTLKWEEIQLAF
jgi:hypothetical protein